MSKTVHHIELQWKSSGMCWTFQVSSDDAAHLINYSPAEENQDANDMWLFLPGDLQDDADEMTEEEINGMGLFYGHSLVVRPDGADELMTKHKMMR